MKEIGKRLGLKVEFNDFAFAGVLDALRLGQVDAAIAAISVTPDRQELVDFSNLYYVGDDAAVARKADKTVYRSATDFKGKKVGVERGTTYQSWAQQSLVDKGVIPQSNLVAYDNTSTMLTDVQKKKADVALMGLLPANDAVKRYSGLRIAGSKMNTQQFAIAARKGSTLVDQLNRALIQVQSDGTFAKLVDQYLNVKPSDVTPGGGVSQPVNKPAEEPSGPPPCIYGMQYVADLNLDDKNMTAPPVMQPGQKFTKSWRVKNSGTCAWEPDFSLNYVQGNRPEAQMGGQPVAVGRVVEPGQTIDLSVNLQAPQVYGTFQAFWQMRDNTGRYFGEVIWVGIQVLDPNAPAQPPPAAVNPNLRADSTHINPGECTTIRWDIDNVSAVYFIDGGSSQGVGGHDSRVVCPTATTTYVLRVVLPDKSVKDFPITITVGGGPATINFWVDRSTINAGECTTLHWDVQNVQAVYLDNQGVAGTDSKQVCPTTTTTYTLRVVRRDGVEETRQVVVNVVNSPVPPSISSFTASANQIGLGQCVTLAWSVSNATAINLARGGAILQQNAPANGSHQDCPQQPGLYEYDLTAWGNGMVSQRVTVNVLGP